MKVGSDIDLSKDLSVGTVFFMVAKRFTEELELEFGSFLVDGQPISTATRGELPGNQGHWCLLGAFPAGWEIIVHWAFRTGIRVPNTEVLVGHFQNGKLTGRTVVLRTTLDTFENYEGEMNITPVKP